MSTPINNPTWAGPALFTPLYLEALMVGQKNQNGDWAAVAVDYAQLGIRGASPQPTPFQVAATAPTTGIHLLWTAPSALRHGQVGDHGDMRLPLLPNRWLVTRSFIAQPGDVPRYTAWVLESDFLGTAADGTHPYPDPDGGSQRYFIGRRYDIGAWNGATSQYHQGFLRAMGPGDPSYVAVYDNMTNVLSFLDDMRQAGNGLYSYSVCGWYGTPSYDILLGVDADHPQGFTTEQEWQDIMHKLLWSVGDAADQAAAEQDWSDWLVAHPVSGGPPLTDAQKNWPGQNLCHGFLYNLQWQGAAAFYPINPILQGTTPPTVAIGANAAEALAAWLGKEAGSAGAEQMLLAFQQDMIFDYVRDPSVFQARTHQARFANHNGGSLWVVYRADQTSSATEIPQGSYTVPLDENATAALTQLNRSQFQLDAAEQLQVSLQSQLYDAYWKLANYPRTTPGLQAQIQQHIDSLTPQVQQIGQQITGLSATVERERNALLALVGPLQLKLNLVNLPRYEARQDPVVLIAGAQQDTKFAAPGAHEEEQVLFTRFTGQTISAIHVLYDSGLSLDVTLASGDFPQIIWPSGKLLPKEINDFWFETFLLDTNNARLIARTAFAKGGITPSNEQWDDLTAQIQRQQTLPWNQEARSLIDARTIADTAGLLGVPPAKLSVAAWSAPWAPLYLDWEIAWHPSAATPQQMLANWDLAEFDFVWNQARAGGNVGPAAGNYVGRSLLNAQIAQGLSDKLSDFLQHDPNAASLPQYQRDQLQAMADDIAEYDVLTQSMSGLIEQLLMQQLQMSKLSTAQAPGVAELLQHASSSLPAAGSDLFYPIHAGHFRLVRLNVVDAFGQILRGSQLGDQLQPIRSSSLVTQNFPQYMQLTPRITQPLRLDLRMVQYNDDTVRSNASDLTSAICGWVIPNHINHSLIVFDPAGNNLGEVLMIDNGNDGGDSGTGLRWDAVPGSDGVLGAPPEFGASLRHLNDFVNGLLLRGAQGVGALESLLDVIDSSLWNIDPLGQPMQGNLAILLGRPIALVRALATLGVDGTPAYNQSWLDTGKNVTGDFTSVPLPVRIGDLNLSNNGLMGYFLDDDYSRLFPYRGFDRQLAIPRRVIADHGIAPRAKLAHMMQRLDAAALADAAAAGDGYLVDDPGFTLKPDGVMTRSLTMLVDPRGWVPALSGYLPVQWLALPPGPVNAALSNMFVTFRSGPLLLEEYKSSMPLPATIKGRWTWVERSGVTTWSESGPLTASDGVAALPAARPVLSEGWLKLSGAQGK
ncbi:hypothetical protein [Janthinobacterium agaricidamnosum]|uniref:Uncharacterized protein n=1 Tax=Janthinobacterium agaricidamnosum NBRC 102515 = DSM 9628 TaxID=1349767 RepID=W0V312_9BURK|nr:hypothetical protein [Janthinobacterium agaricidamnosum]CDG81662.1 hypothetical protein GJA_1007 [Janthinobacterium agaricidamnosum NBRC 102515 = DSM 9628]